MKKTSLISFKNKLETIKYILKFFLWFRFSKNGKIFFDTDINCWVAEKIFNTSKLQIPVRSFRELRRIYDFGKDKDELLLIWLETINDCETFYDIGSANGIEGLYLNARHGSKIIFVELNSLGIESIIKGTYLAQKRGEKIDKFEIISAGCDDKTGFSKVFYHEPPQPGITINSFDDVNSYCRGGRSKEKIYATQWSQSITIDSISEKLGIDKPNHVKIDVDGFEVRVLKGAIKTLESKTVKSWLIEINPGEGREEFIYEKMIQNEYTLIDKQAHYPDLKDAEDQLFVRNDLVDEFRAKLLKIKKKINLKN